MKIWVNGCFDVLHYGHFSLLKYASSLGSQLIVGIDSDKRIEIKKGKHRPFHKQKQRKFNLLCLKFVNKVVVFKTDEELEKILKKENPDIIVIGEEYKNKKIIGKQYVKKIKFFKKLKTFSTSNILNDLAKKS
jgi:D-beta-D-heptose 7-phosphate kinase/D-beta-D-heptose 1-phosphate adenosyltransferase